MNSVTPLTSPSQADAQNQKIRVITVISSSESSSPSRTSTQSPSATASSSSTASMTPSPTGFPVQSVIDNTGAGTIALDATSSRQLSATTRRAVSFYLPETDARCGPGSYVLRSITLGLSPDGVSAGDMAPLAIELYVAASDTGLPASSASQVILESVGPMSNGPSYFTIDLPSSWSINATFQRWYSIVVFVTSSSVHWIDPVDGVIGHVPLRGFGLPHGSFQSTDSGASWQSNASYAAVGIHAQKTACSPTSSLSTTPTPSSTPSVTATQSQSRSSTLTPSSSFTGPTVLDGTAGLTAAVLPGVSSDISTVKSAAVAFSVIENDSSCGPGRYYSLTQLWLPLSQVSTAVVDIRLELFTTDVSVYWVLK